APMPREPPVTSATLPASGLSRVVFISVSSLCFPGGMDRQESAAAPLAHPMITVSGAASVAFALIPLPPRSGPARRPEPTLLEHDAHKGYPRRAAQAASPDIGTSRIPSPHTLTLSASALQRSNSRSSHVPAVLARRATR